MILSFARPKESIQRKGRPWKAFFPVHCPFFGNVWTHEPSARSDSTHSFSENRLWTRGFSTGSEFNNFTVSMLFIVFLLHIISRWISGMAMQNNQAERASLVSNCYWIFYSRMITGSFEFIPLQCRNTFTTTSTPSCAPVSDAGCRG